MLATVLKTHDIVPEEKVSARAVYEFLARARSQGTVKLVVEISRGRPVTIALSGKLVEAIKDLSLLFQEGSKIGFFADDPELSPEEASDLLGLSRPTVVQRIKQGDLKARMVGAHHRIPMSELLAFRKKEMKKSDEVAERNARVASMKFAIANTTIEGGNVLPETESLLEKWAEGKIGDDEMMEEALRRYGPGA